MRLEKKAILFLIVLAAVSLLTACSANIGNGSETTVEPTANSQSVKWFSEPRLLDSGDSYESSEYYLLNEETGRHIYTVETKPAGLAEGEKVPIVIYVHGQSGEATTFAGIYRRLTEEKVAALSFECCGGNRSGAKSEGSKLFPAHYTSRITDLETVMAKAKTLDYVDPDRIFFFGESYGGAVISLAAIDHNEVAGLILLSTGLETMMGDEDSETYLAAFDKENPMEAIKGYTGDVICFNGDLDFAFETGRAQIEVYQQREKGTAVFYEMEGSDHSYSAFTPEGKVFVIDTMVDFIRGH